MIDKKTVKKSLIIILLLIIIIFVFVKLRQTLARYETTTTTERDVDVAFLITDASFKTDRLLIEKIYPTDEETFEYTFSVSNFDAGHSAETDLSYELEIITTTNMPLEYEIQKNGTTCNKTEEIITDANGTCYRKISSIISTDANDTNIFQVGTDEIDEFVLKVNFPLKSYVNGVEVENRANLDYPDLMEDVKIQLTATQIVDGE